MALDSGNGPRVFRLASQEYETAQLINHPEAPP